MADPTAGHAAAGNHIMDRHPKHHHGVVATPPANVVFREPSTWEIMIKAEIAGGEMKRASDLVTRVEGRAFPEAGMSAISLICDLEADQVFPSCPSTPEDVDGYWGRGSASSQQFHCDFIKSYPLFLTQKTHSNIYLVDMISWASFRGRRIFSSCIE